MEIAALGITIVYLLVIAAGAIVALSVLVWLFGEAPGESTRSGHETVEGLPYTDHSGAGRIPPASVGSERSEGEAA